MAVLCGTRVTMPYAMSVMGSELLRACFVEHAETLGDAMLSAKRRMIHTDDPMRLRQSLDRAARARSPNAAQLEAERAEHVDLFNLLGDPLLRLPQALPVAVDVASIACAGRRDSRFQSTRRWPRRHRRARGPPRSADVPSPARRSFEGTSSTEYMDTYRRANEPRWVTTQVKLDRGQTVARFSVPAEARGPCHVRVFISGNDNCAVGAADLRIDPATTTAARPYALRV